MIKIEQQGTLGLIGLNRPEALNALNHAMIAQIDAALEQWRGAAEVETILIHSLCDKAFCAGGDVRAAACLPYDAAVEYFAHEYQLNYKIATYPKPIIALLDGLALGGGLGLALHASHVVVTDRAWLAMPEMAIGLFPDVGAASFLNKMPLPWALWMALTGARLSGGDAVHLGLATHYIHSQKCADFTAALRAGTAWQPLTAPPPAFSLSAEAAEIEAVFAEAQTIEAILTTPHRWHALLSTFCPTSLHIAWQHVRQGRNQPIATVLERDFTLVQHCLARPDFKEGVRAMLIDKDKSPRFKAVDKADVAAHFMPTAHLLWQK